jgi:hypothetical protein
MAIGFWTSGSAAKDDDPVTDSDPEMMKIV